MAQTTKSAKRSRGTRSGPRAGSSSKSAASKRPSSKRSGSNGNGSRAKRTSTGRSRPRSRSTARGQTGAESIKNGAIDKTKAVGHTVGEAASRAKTPLIAGGTALVGVAAGAVLKGRLDNRGSRSPLGRLRGVSMPKSVRNADLTKIDLGTVKKAAERVSAYGQQASDIAAAVEKTRKKNG